MMNEAVEVDFDLSISKPVIGMEFETIEASVEFWNKYAHDSGFGGRIKYTNKRPRYGVISSRRYVCSQEGKKGEDLRRVHSKHRADSRCECNVRMGISLNDNGKYVVTSFIEQHNHDLEGNDTTHLLRAHRSINEVQARTIDIVVGAGLGPKMMHRYMSIEAGGFENVGFTREDVKSHLRTKRETNLELGEATTILEYFQEQSELNTSFFHDFQLDCDGQITNIFWADPKMVVDYQVFGDVVMFDTTFGTNKESRPLGIFTGFNNHRQTVVFGGSLLFDETAASFGWLFNVFLRCHGEKRPNIIFTDQDAAMKSALEVVMPGVRHGLCTWHILQNAMKNLSGLLGGKKNGFMSELSRCMYEFPHIVEFEERWKNMIEHFDLAGTRTTQLSESVNARVKLHLGNVVRMKKFFSGFDMFLTEVRQMEKFSDCKSHQTVPHLAISNCSILQHAAETYTPNVFKLFNEQFCLEYNVSLDRNDHIDVSHVRIANEGGKSYNVTFDPSSMTIACTCSLYEMRGYLCSHILRVFNVLRIQKIPDKYILKRWTRHAKNGLASAATSFGSRLTDKQKLDILCSEWARVAYHAFRNDDAFERVRCLISEAHSILDKFELPISNGHKSNPPNPHELTHVGVKGLKRKSNHKTVQKRRIRSCLENARRRKHQSKATSSQVTDEQVNYSNEYEIRLTL